MTDVKKIISSVTLGLFVVFCAYSPAFGADAPANDELLKQIQELKNIIQQQNARISALEKKVSGQQEEIDSHSEVIEKEGLQDVFGERP